MSSTNCLICHFWVGMENNFISIFDNNLTLRSGKKYPEVISEITGETITKETAASVIICKKCNKLCTEYHGMQQRLDMIKTNLCKQYEASSAKFTEAKEISELSNVKTGKGRPRKAGMMKVVLPASQLRPLPANYVLPTADEESGANEQVTLSEENSSSLIKILNKIKSSKEANVKGDKTITVKPKVTRSPPATIFDMAVLSKLDNGNGENSDSIEIVEHNEEENVDEQPMEIDVDCSFSGTEVERNSSYEETSQGAEQNEDDKKSDSVALESGSMFDNLELDRLVVGTVEILADDHLDLDGGDHTILMQDEEGSLVRVITGQKFLYGDDEVSLLVPQDETSQQENQDSNDGSQIELQVSGDEETANAIMAAAAEEGGAFIKVESGEMYRVESVRSRPPHDDILAAMIERVADAGGKHMFRCKMCANDTNPEANASRATAPLPAAAAAQHLRHVHAARIYICELCGEACRKRSEFTAHMAEHSNTELPDDGKKTTFPCTVCRKKFWSKALLAEHARAHTAERPYTCDTCSKSFASKYIYQAHRKTHEERVRSHKCGRCSKAFYTASNLLQHERLHRARREFKCPECGKMFATQYNLEMHGVTHSGAKPFVCGVCDRGFARKAEVADHIRTHTGERPFGCSVCGARFTQRSNLLSHMRDTHSDSRKHECTECGAKFKRKRLLNYHVAAAHTGHRPYHCDICGHSFVYPEHYKKHQRIHTGERPFSCEVCGKTFNTADNRNSHRFVHSAKKPYECLACGAGFMRKPLLYAHMNSSGHMTESIVVNQPRVTAADAPPQGAGSAEGVESAAGAESAEGGEGVVTLCENMLEDGTKIGDNQLIIRDENNELVRVIQIELPNGESGWLALSKE